MEIWDAYDKDSNKLGFDIIRGKERIAGVYHLVVEALIKHVDGSFLLVQRSHSKTIFPGVFESSAGGSVLKGETVDQAILREVYEETGIDSIISIKQVSRTVMDNHTSIFYSYIIETDFTKDKLIMDQVETIAYKWISKDDYLEYSKSDHNIPLQIKRLDKYIQTLK